MRGFRRSGEFSGVLEPRRIVRVSWQACAPVWEKRGDRHLGDSLLLRIASVFCSYHIVLSAYEFSELTLLRFRDTAYPYTGEALRPRRLDGS